MLFLVGGSIGLAFSVLALKPYRKVIESKEI
jgi:hypothetical protein